MTRSRVKWTNMHLHGDIVDSLLNVLTPPRRNEESVAKGLVANNRRAGWAHDNRVIGPMSGCLNASRRSVHGAVEEKPSEGGNSAQAAG